MAAPPYSTKSSHPRDIRLAIRRGEITGPTPALAPGFVQANLVAVPAADAFDFLLFATRNPRPCPIIEVVDSGTEPVGCASGADLRTDVPRYRVHSRGRLVDRPIDASRWWRDDLVGFLLGCSFSFDALLVAAGLPVRHLEMGTNVPMYITDRACRPAGRFGGPLVVSMRPIPADRVDEAAEMTAGFPHAHGAPVHAGDPAALGIADLATPDFGDPVPVEKDEVPVFWACGVTPQVALGSSPPDVVITHEPGHMFITDLPLDRSDG